jgi:hypothetical protein
MGDSIGSTVASLTPSEQFLLLLMAGFVLLPLGILWRIFGNRDVTRWKALIPIYNTWLLLHIVLDEDD